MSTLVTIVHVLVCIFLMLTVLLQSGKGGGMGGAFGGGSTQTVFGGSGGSTVLRKVTVIVAALFMITSMTLAWISSNTGADALRRFSAQQRRAAQIKQEARDEALKGVPPVTDGDTNEDGTEGGIGDDADLMPDLELDGTDGETGDQPTSPAEDSTAPAEGADTTGATPATETKPAAPAETTPAAPAETRPAAPAETKPAAPATPAEPQPEPAGDGN
jgi:preprotein translocase subunit SecG